MVISVEGPAAASETAACFLRLTSHVAGGGRAVYCLKSVRGSPGPHALVRIRGMVAFRLPHRVLRARVLIVDRFAADGTHARQSLTGTLVGGGTIAGGGTFLEDPPGHVRTSHLRYRLMLR